MQSIQNAASVIIDSICSYLLYTKDVIHLKQTCKQFNRLELYEASGHAQPHGIKVYITENSWNGTYTEIFSYQDGMMHGRQYMLRVPAGVPVAEVGPQYIERFFDYKRGVAHGLYHIYNLDDNGKQYLAFSQYRQNGDTTGQMITYKPNGEIKEVCTSSVRITEHIADGWKEFHIEEGSLLSECRFYTLRADGVLLNESRFGRTTRRAYWRCYSPMHYIPPELAKRGQKRMRCDLDGWMVTRYSLSIRERKRKMKDMLTIEEASGGLLETTYN